MSATDLQRATRRGVLLDRPRAHDTQNAWWDWCQRHRRPFALYRLRRTYGYALVDLAPTELRLTDEALAAAVPVLLDLAQQRGRSEVWYGPEGLSVDGLYREDAAGVA